MKKVSDFYESFPYPQLPVSEKKDVARHLHETVMKRILASANLRPDDLNGKSVLDAGCGTGEKSAYFAMHGARAFGIDLSENSLSLAKKNAKKFGAEKICKFEKISIFDLEKHFLPNSFDHIFSIGVIHHTENPEKCVEIFSRLLKKGGTLTLGLYHLYGRLPLRIHRACIKALTSGKMEGGLKYVEKSILRRPFKSQMEKAYLADTYLHPHETYHSIGEAKKWLSKNRLQFIGTMPKCGGIHEEISWLAARKGFFFISGRKG